MDSNFVYFDCLIISAGFVGSSGGFGSCSSLSPAVAVTRGETAPLLLVSRCFLPVNNITISAVKSIDILQLVLFCEVEVNDSHTGMFLTPF